MAPEHPKRVGVMDLSFKGNRLVGLAEYYEAPKELRVTWDAESQPKGYAPLYGGIAYYYVDKGNAPTVLPDRLEPPVLLDDSSYLWKQGGYTPELPAIMLIIILPQGYTLTGFQPIPIGAKMFNGRLAVCWDTKADSNYRADVMWALKPFSGDLSSEIQRINKMHAQAPGSSPIETMEKISNRPLKVFLCHTSGDKPAVRALYRWLIDEKIDVWLDEENLLPGQDWQIEIRKAVQSSDAIIICISNKSITKEGYVQKEIKFALDIADEKPEGTIFIIPCRLEECSVPDRLSRWQYVDLFFYNGFFTKGHEKLLRALHERAQQLGIESPKSFLGTSKTNRSVATKKRLEADHTNVLELIKKTNGKITLEQTKGTPPEVYIFSFKCRIVLSLRENEPLWGNKVTVKIALPEEYPRLPAIYEVLSPLYHPQVSDSILCAGWGNSQAGLDSLVMGLYQIVAFLNYSLNSPMDSGAAHWYRQHPEIIKELQSANSQDIAWLGEENILSQG